MGNVPAALNPFVSPKGASKLRNFRWLVASLTASVWLFTGFLAVSPDWHHCFHEDSETGQHHCLVSKYSDGDFLTPSGGAILAVSISLAEPRIVRLETFVSSDTDHLLPPGRAPPLL